MLCFKKTVLQLRGMDLFSKLMDPTPLSFYHAS